MPARSDITYFGAGPALLPTAVLEEAAEALLNYQDTGLGGMELQRETLVFPSTLFPGGLSRNDLSSAVVNT